MTWFLPVALGYLGVACGFATLVLKRDEKWGHETDGGEALLVSLFWLPILLYVLVMVAWWAWDCRKGGI